MGGDSGPGRALGERFEDNESAEKEVVGYIEGFYNSQRRHSAFGHVSPAERERQYRMRHEQQAA